MARKNLKDQVRSFLSDLSGKENVGLYDDLQSDLGFDSLGMVTMLLSLEDTFGFTLEQSDMNPYDLVTVSDVIILAERYYEQ